MKLPRPDLAAWGYQAGWSAVKWLPESLARTTFDKAGDFAGGRNGGPAQLRRNLARALGTPDVPDSAVRAAMRSYARYWREAFRMPNQDAAVLASQVTVGRQDLVYGAYNRGKGVIFVLPHSGNWDLAGVWLIANVVPTFATVVERLQPESLFQKFVWYREQLGFEIYPLSGGQAPPFPQLRAHLQAGGICCLLGDRDLTPSGVPVTLFGETTRFPAGPAKLALETGAALIPVCHVFHDDPLSEILVSDEVSTTGRSVAEITQDVADAFTAMIGQYPTDWHMLQPLWEADWSAERTARLAADPGTAQP